MLSVLTLEQSEKWDDIVRSFKEHDVYWLSGYTKAFELNGDGTPLLFFYDDGNVRGINVVMKRDIALHKHFKTLLQEGEYFDFSTPYGYGGWLVEGQDSNKLFAAYEDYCKKERIVSEFVRFHPLIENHRFCCAHYQTVPLGKVVVMDTAAYDTVWANLTSKNRNMVRKAEKNGVEVKMGNSPELYGVFRQIYNATMDKDNAADYYYFGEGFYKSVGEDLAHAANIFYAVYGDKIIAAAIMLEANGRMNYHLSGSLTEYAGLAPTNLILCRAAEYCSSKGIKTLYLGGGVGSGEDGLYKFKKSFNRNEDTKRFYIGKKIFCDDVYQKLVSLRNGVEASGYFPQYRA